MGLMRRLTEGRAVKDGIPAEAVVVKTMLPTSDARNYQITASVRVERLDRQPYQVELPLLAPRAKVPIPGSRLPVRVDPKDPERVQVVWDEAAAADKDAIQFELSEGLRSDRIRLVSRHNTAVEEAQNLFNSSGEPSVVEAELADPQGEEQA